MLSNIKFESSVILILAILMVVVLCCLFTAPSLSVPAYADSDAEVEFEEEAEDLSENDAYYLIYVCVAGFAVIVPVIAITAYALSKRSKRIKERRNR